MGKKCVKCGSHNTAEYLYGMPIMDDELKKNIDDKKVILGGCTVTEFNPKYHCNECKQDFGYSAKRLSNDAIIDYIESTYYLEFGMSYDNLICVAETKVVFEKRDDRYFVTFFRNKKKYFKEITEKEFIYNISAFFEKAYILEWEDDCINTRSSIDTRWNYVIKCKGVDTIENHGKDYFPPYFKQAKLRHDYFSCQTDKEGYYDEVSVN